MRSSQEQGRDSDGPLHEYLILRRKRVISQSFSLAHLRSPSLKLCSRLAPSAPGVKDFYADPRPATSEEHHAEASKTLIWEPYLWAFHACAVNRGLFAEYELVLVQMASCSLRTCSRQSFQCPKCQDSPP